MTTTTKIKHGSTSSYVNHDCRCDACKRAMTETRKGRIEIFKLTGQLPDGTEHGYATYTNYGCRCETCTTAAAVNRRTKIEQAAEQGLAAMSKSPHGSTAAATNYGCRCRGNPELCKSRAVDIKNGTLNSLV